MYHKMGTVWWQHVLRVLCFATGEFVFEVNSQDGDAMAVRGRARDELGWRSGLEGRGLVEGDTHFKTAAVRAVRLKLRATNASAAAPSDSDNPRARSSWRSLRPPLPRASRPSCSSTTRRWCRCGRCMRRCCAAAARPRFSCRRVKGGADSIGARDAAANGPQTRTSARSSSQPPQATLFHPKP